MGREAIDTAFPFPSYREHQRAALQESARALFGNTGTDTVVLDAPTGIGKSGINVALCRLADSAFYTTPQKQLRNQLETDGDLQAHYRALRARTDYHCPVGTARAPEGREHNCKTCPINRGSDTCTDYACPYWGAKEDAMGAHTALLTFAYLIIDSRMPVNADTWEANEGQSEIDNHGRTQVSFEDRDLLVVDEAHKLEEQAASLHAGFTLSPRTLMTASVEELIEEDYPTAPLRLVDSLSDVPAATRSLPSVVEKPGRLYGPFNERLKAAVADAGGTEDVTVDDILPALKAALQTARGKLEALEHINLKEKHAEVVSELESVVQKIEDNLLPDIEAGRQWVVSIENTVPGADEPRYKAKLKPVRVDRFLQEYVWDRADKVVLSTATMPYRNNPGKWLSRLGLDSDSATVVSKPMPFPPENRPVKTETAVGKMSNGGDKRNWDGIVARLYSLLNRHSDEKGLVHTASYDRARRLHETFEEHSVLHEQNGRDDEFFINKWQHSDKQMLFTPAMTDGVDLPGDMCRWQVLLKVPYPPLSDPRAKHLVNVEEDWEWYMDVTARDVIQSVGRAVRSTDDEATFYVLDASFHDVIDGKAPDWFTEAVGI